jgi:hypothetical protein
MESWDDKRNSRAKMTQIDEMNDIAGDAEEKFRRKRRSTTA